MSQVAEFANQFKAVFEKAAEASTNMRERIENEIAKLKQKRAEINEKIRDLDMQLQELNQDVAAALQHAAKDAGLQIVLTGNQPVLKSRILCRMLQACENVIIKFAKLFF